MLLPSHARVNAPPLKTRNFKWEYIREYSPGDSIAGSTTKAASLGRFSFGRTVRSSPRLLSSEPELQRQLDNPRSIQRGRHLRARRAVDRGRRRRKDRMIPDVEELAAELDLFRLRNGEQLHHREVHLLETVGAHDIASAGAVAHLGRRHGECILGAGRERRAARVGRNVKPAGGIARQHWDAHRVRTLTAHTGIGDVAGNTWGEGLT